MNNLVRIVGVVLLLGARGASAQDLWQFAEYVVHVAGGQACRALQFTTAADSSTFEKLSHGQFGCALGWGAQEAPPTKLQLNQYSDLGLTFTLPSGKVDAFIAQGALNPWDDGEELGLGVNLYARHYSLRLGASCASDFSYCNSPTLAIHSKF